MNVNVTLRQSVLPSWYESSISCQEPADARILFCLKCRSLTHVMTASWQQEVNIQQFINNSL